MLKFQILRIASFLSIWLLCELPNANADKQYNRVLNGSATTDATPWMVSLQHPGDNGVYMHFCGGALINADTVLTAAHCVSELASTPDRLELQIGSSRLSAPNAERAKVIGIIVHPDYDDVTSRNDIALIKLARPSSSTGFAQPVAPTEFAALFGSELRLYGWGFIYGDVPVRPDALQAVDMPLISDQQCSERLGLDFDPGSMICAGRLATSAIADDGRDACQGDSGGPLVAYRNGRAEVIGIVSWGFGCGSSKVWGIYTRVAPFLDWINSSPAVPPYLKTEVEVLGIPEAGGTLKCNPGSWGGAVPRTFSYVWMDQELGPISGHRKTSYRLSRRDVGRIISCVVTAKNPGGTLEIGSAETMPILPHIRSNARTSARNYCSGNQCIVLVSSRQSVRSARAILVPHNGSPKVQKAIFASSNTVALRYRRGTRGTVTFRIVTKAGKVAIVDAKL